MQVVLKTGGLLVIGGMVLALCALTYVNCQKAKTLETFGGGSSLGDAAAGVGMVRVPKQGELIAPDTQIWRINAVRPAEAKRSQVAVAGAPWKGDAHALHVETIATDPAWGIRSVELVKAVAMPVSSGKAVEIAFWARSQSKATLETNLSERKPTFNSTLGDPPVKEEFTKQENLTPEWKQFVYPLTTKSSHEAGALRLSLAVGTAPGSAEFAQVKVVEK